MSDSRSEPVQDQEWPRPIVGWYAVGVLTVAYVFSFIDRTIIALMVQPIKADLQLSDTQIGILHGLAFAVFYTLLGLPIGWLADRRRRKTIISAGIFVWSVMTALCGLAKNFWHLFLARVGVGVGEAALSPPAYSMMADYFPPHKLGRPIGVYSSAINLGAGLAFMVGGAVVQFFRDVHSVPVPMLGELYSWQLAFIAVGLPGVLVAALMMTVREPARRGLRQQPGGNKGIGGFPRWLYRHRGPLMAQILGISLVGIPIQVVISWVPTYLIRVHDFSQGDAGFAVGFLFLAFGASGMVLGGVVTDWFKARGHDNAPLRTGLLGAVAATPFAISATLVPDWLLSVGLLGPMVFFLSLAIGAAPTGLQLITPNDYRAQITAVYLLLLNLIATGFAPLLTALATDYLFRSEAAVGWSIALVSGLATPIAALIFVSGLRPYTKAAAERAA